MEISSRQDNLGRIGVLMGGPSAEREISLKSGKAVYESLKQSGIEVIAIDIKTDDIKENIRLIELHKINCAFLALHGRFGEDGQIQQILDDLKLPYTGSDVGASRLAMDKIASHKVFMACGLNVPRYEVIEKPADPSPAKAGSGCPSLFGRKSPGGQNFKFPLVVKPAACGSSVGLSIVDKEDELAKALELAFNFDERALIEEYISGREVTVGILDEQALPVIEIVPKKRFFDYEAKYQPGMTDYIVPAKLEDEVIRQLKLAALKAHRVLDCFGCCRVDMILRDDNAAFILEVNTIPGLTQTSLLPKAAKVAGIDFAKLCIKLIQLAYEKAQSQQFAR